MLAQTKKTYTIEEYLELELASETRSEYRNGEIISMTGGTPNHSDIACYPDIMVVEKPLQLQPGRKDTVMNPVLNAEVLSKSTRDYDHGDKFSAYRTLNSCREYLLIDQYSIHVEHYVKTAANQWLLSEYDDLAVVLTFSSFEAEVTIAALYENIDFAKA